MRLRTLALAVLLVAVPARPGAAATDPARTLLLTGHDDEARRAYEQRATTDPIGAAIGVARCREAVGGADEALRGLTAAAAKRPAPALDAEIARLLFARGRHAEAQRHVDAALAADAEQPLAHYLLAELHRVAGRLDEANEAYVWFIRLYNAQQDSLRDPETLLWIGRAAAQYARWNRNSSQFHFLIDTLYPDALKLDANYWPAHLDQALLFIEKYNLRDAQGEIDAALAINPRAAAVHAARARIALQRFDLDSARTALDRALAIDPQLLPALQLRADLDMLAGGPRAALPALEAARALDPVDEQTLGRLAAVYGAVEGLRDTAHTRMAAIVAETIARNPHCGTLFAQIGASLDLLQRMPDALKAYEEARRRMPQLVEVAGQLGLEMLRLGDEQRGRAVLEEAFEADPFNARVKNTLDVLAVLEDYGTIQTPHFVIRYDLAQDSLLARYAARHLEGEVYPEVTKAFGYEPPGRTLIELFSRHNGVSGHGWFSQRMTGQPFIGTVGASTGPVVALTTPAESPFNWARVLKHEFVHVVNLQQTGYAIPRWTTEGLAVTHEGPGHPAVWEGVLSRRAACDSLFDLGSITTGFVRPSSGADWALAYYQATLYVRFLTERFGADAVPKLIAAYTAHAETPEAIRRATGLDQKAFESRYRAWVTSKVAAPTHAPCAETAADGSLPALQRAAEAAPRDPHVLARLARGYLRVSRQTEARDRAEKALAMDAHEPVATVVLAELDVANGATDQAIARLRAAIDAAPQPEPIAMLGSLMLGKKDAAEAARLARVGEQRFPGAANWLQLRIDAARAASQKDTLAALLERRADGDPDDLGVRMELARLADARNDAAALGHWALETIHVDVMSAEAHALLARADAARSRNAEAIEEFETAIRLQPGQRDWQLGLAGALAHAGQTARARALLNSLLASDPGDAKARAALEGLGR